MRAEALDVQLVRLADGRANWQIGRGAAVLSSYERVTFEKMLINVQGKPTAAFICPGSRPGF